MEEESEKIKWSNVILVDFYETLNKIIEKKIEFFIRTIRINRKSIMLNRVILFMFCIISNLFSSVSKETGTKELFTFLKLILNNFFI